MDVVDVGVSLLVSVGVVFEEEDRPNVLARGPRCVPLSSIHCQYELLVDFLLSSEQTAPLLRFEDIVRESRLMDVLRQ